MSPPVDQHNPADGDGIGYAWELEELRRVLDEATVVGHPRRAAELAELARLVHRYPDEARELLGMSEQRQP